MSALTKRLVFFIVCCVTDIKGSITDDSAPLLKSSLVQLKSSQNVGGIQSSSVDIHVAMDSNITPSNIKSLLREELNSILKDCNNSILNNTQLKIPLPTQNCSSEDKNLAKELADFKTSLHNIENILKGIETNKEKPSHDVDNRVQCPKIEQSLGVICNNCPKPTKDQKSYPTSCKEIQRNGNNVTGIYHIFPKNAEEPFPVLCDMEIKGGGWTHIQKRFDGSQDFYLGWRDYKFGFGNFDGEFWLGLQKIHILSGFEPTELLVEIVDRDNVTAHAHYTSFGIGSEPDAYKLDRLSESSGDAGDSLKIHLGCKFSTKDLDFTKNACATKYLGGYWYSECHHSNLNGKYINIDLPEKFKFQGLHWKTFRGHEYSHAKSRMLVRPVN